MQSDVQRGRKKLVTALTTLGILSVVINLGFGGGFRGLLRMAIEVAIVASIWSYGSRGGLTMIGGLLTAMGVLAASSALTGDAYTPFHRAFLVAASAVWVGIGMFFLMSFDIRAFLDSRAGIRRQIAGSDDERWGSSQGVQIVGSACGVCSKRFATDLGAVICEPCSKAFHVGVCLDSHRDSAHADATSA